MQNSFFFLTCINLVLIHGNIPLSVCVFHNIYYSTGTARNVSLESSQPSCPNDPLLFNCSVDFPSLFILWDHEAFAPITFLGVNTFVGNSSSTSDGRVVAELTMREDNGGGLYLLASTLTIYPPLTDLNNINLNGTNIKCEGSDGPRESAFASIVVEGEELKICLVLHDCITSYIHVSLSVQIIFQLLITSLVQLLIIWPMLQLSGILLYTVEEAL